MTQHNQDSLESIYTAHLFNQIHANLDLLLKQSKISPNNVDVIKNALSQQPSPNSALPEPSFRNHRAPSLPQPSLTTDENSYSENQASHHHPTSSFQVPPPPPAHQPPQQYKRAKALWAYRGSATDDLSFEKGDIIIVLVEENADWWRGQVLNSQNPGGLFPSNHVEVISTPSQSGYSPSPQYQPNHSVSPYPTGPPQGNPGYQSPAYTQAPHYGDYKAPHAAGPPPPLQHTQSAPPVNVTVEKPKKNLLQGRFGQALAGGAGFGAGSAVASHVVNAIL